MTQHQLDCAVAIATGEALQTVRHFGFSTSRPGEDLDPEDLGLAVDCPFCGRSCDLGETRDGLPAMAECDPCDIYFEYRTGDVYPTAIAANAA